MLGYISRTNELTIVARRNEMVVLTATCRNGLIQLDQRLPDDLEGK